MTSTTRRIAAGIAAGAAAAAFTLAAAGPAAAGPGPQISCAGPRCTNTGDTVGIGFGTYTCPNGIGYPSIAIVFPRSTASVYPANCNPTGFPNYPR
ncbi:hypothetical protein [Williamsia maris]|uniref:Uncharacterized protein n=1 Tax=Williamsia maris TaxID=72806 RepID=A0ABT1HBR4_9NOCA|nr:hypothetical protein [Williamsia maris]MCP2175702.1 hypothetical protein [Williamsia maris]